MKMLKKPVWSTLFWILLLLLPSPILCSRNINLETAKARGPTIRRTRHHHNDNVIVDNGIVQITFSSPQGHIKGIKYNGLDNVLNPRIHPQGYWDVTWKKLGGTQQIDRVEGTKFEIITQNEEQVELSFSRTWDASNHNSSVPLNVDKRYIIRNNSPGVYIYGIFERLEGWPDVEMGLVRVVYKPNPKNFHYVAVSDDRQRNMPADQDRDVDRGRARRLDYKEAVQIIKPRDSKFKGQVDDKYQYTCEAKDNKVHGWVASKPRVGFWLISPSEEYRVGGPMKQELASHTGPTTLATFISVHYVGKEMRTEYVNGEPWKKILGPVFIYLNSGSSNDGPQDLWTDAKRQMSEEVSNWPYNFVASKDFLRRDQRGEITGQLQVKESFPSFSTWGNMAYVGLTTPGEPGLWQTETKGYQFWTQANETGYFTIKNIIPGTYRLNGWVPGFIGDYQYAHEITITPGSVINLGKVVYEPPRSGPTLWEIGVPDRKAAEFYVPDPLPKYTSNFLTNSKNKFRQYGLWSRYTDLYPRNDLVYTVGTSNYTRDWFYAHVTRNVGDGTYRATTWQIRFNLQNAISAAGYKLRIALASAMQANLQVRINDENSRVPMFSTGRVGGDNAIARHGIHGMYRLYSVDVPGRSLRTGENVVYLTQASARGPFQGVMYDYVRLEGGPV